MTQVLDNLIEKRAKAAESLYSHLDGAEEREKKEGYEPAADKEAFEKISADLRGLDSQIEVLNEAFKAEARAEEARAAAGDLGRQQGHGKGDGKGDEPSEAEQFRTMQVGAEHARDFTMTSEEVRALEARDLTVGTATAGGHAVPTGFVPQLMEHLIEHSAIRKTRATVIRTNSGNAMDFPKTTSHGSGGALIAEGGTISEGDPAISKTTLNAYKYAVLVEASNELIEDDEAGFISYLARNAARQVVDEIGGANITGTGSSQPNGVVTASSLGVTAAGAAAITTDELIDLEMSVIGPYRANGEFMMGDSTLAKLRKLKDTTNQYIWQPGLVRGAPNTLLGHPVWTDPNMPASTTGLKSVVFGDFSYYYLRDVRTIRVERSDHFRFDTDMVSWRVVLRHDGDLMDTTGAIKHLIQA